MGLDINSIKFLTHCKQSGVDFGSTAALGRQALQTSESAVADVLTSVGIEPVKLASFPFAEEFFHAVGATEMTNIDASDYEGADLILDLNNPIDESNKGKFDVVVDGGTLEHVFHYSTALKNVMNMVKVGGHVISITPTNNFGGHGFYQFSPELFFRVFSPANGFEPPLVLYRELGFFSSWKRVVDPEALRRRVLRRRGRPALLYVCAKKTSDVDIFSTTPQQSDYVSAWNSSSKGNTARSIFQSVKSKMPPSLRRFLVQINTRYFGGPLFDRKGYEPFQILSQTSESPVSTKPRLG